MNGENLRRLRTIAGVRIADVARHAGVSQATYRRWEEEGPPRDMVVTLGRFLRSPDQPGLSPLARRRLERGWTLEYVARHFDCDPSRIWRWEMESVPLHRLAEVAAFYGIPASELRPDLVKVLQP